MSDILNILKTYSKVFLSSPFQILNFTFIFLWFINGYFIKNKKIVPILNYSYIGIAIVVLIYSVIKVEYLDKKEKKK